MAYSEAIKELKTQWPNVDWETSEEGGFSGDDYVITGDVGRVWVELWSEGEDWFASAGRGVGVAQRSGARPTPTEAVKRVLYLAR